MFPGDTVVMQQRTSRASWRYYTYVIRNVTFIALLENFSVTQEETPCYILNVMLHTKRHATYETSCYTLNVMLHTKHRATH